jgi:hypothetical protein
MEKDFETERKAKCKTDKFWLSSQRHSVCTEGYPEGERRVSGLNWPKKEDTNFSNPHNESSTGLSSSKNLLLHTKKEHFTPFRSSQRMPNSPFQAYSKAPIQNPNKAKITENDELRIKWEEDKFDKRVNEDEEKRVDIEERHRDGGDRDKTNGKMKEGGIKNRKSEEFTEIAFTEENVNVRLLPRKKKKKTKNLWCGFYDIFMCVNKKNKPSKQQKYALHSFKHSLTHKTHNSSVLSNS